MSIPLRVELQMEEARKQARDLAGRFANYKPVMQGPVRRLMREAIDRQFKTRGAFSGDQWPPLAPSTVKRKKLNPAWKKAPMRRTDELFRSLTIYSHPARQEEITAEGYTLRSLIPYGKYHQSTEPRTSALPRRAIIPDQLPQDFMVRLRNLVRGYLIAGEVTE